MIIKAKNFPNIGHIRAKQLGGKEPRWELSIYPPTPGPLQGHEPAHFVEVEVGPEEVERIDRVAPHLISGGDRRTREKLHLGTGPVAAPRDTAELSPVALPAPTTEWPANHTARPGGVSQSLEPPARKPPRPQKAMQSSKSGEGDRK